VLYSAALPLRDSKGDTICAIDPWPMQERAPIACDEEAVAAEGLELLLAEPPGRHRRARAVRVEREFPSWNPLRPKSVRDFAHNEMARAGSGPHDDAVYSSGSSSNVRSYVGAPTQLDRSEGDQRIESSSGSARRGWNPRLPDQCSIGIF
jgi:hypothetical protein